MKKTKILFMILMIITIAMFSSKSYSSWADLTDEEADKEAKEQLVQQEKEQAENKGKSNNNYLSELYVKDYTLTPEFDKQTVNYEIKDKINGKSIEIIAKSDDDKASILGTGIINIESIEEVRIDVTAENGAVRTYYIKLAKTENQEENIYENKEGENITESSEDTILQNEIKKTETKNSVEIASNKTIYILIGFAILILLILILLNIFKKKSKH